MADTKTVSELGPADGPKLIALVVAKALGLPAELQMPKDILAAAQAKLGGKVDTGELPPKPALLQVAKFLAEGGAGGAAGAEPEPEPEVPLSEELPQLSWASLDDLAGVSKGQIVEFMAASCSMEFLQKHKLYGSVLKTITKKAKLPELHTAYAEIVAAPEAVLASPAAKAREAQQVRLASLEKEKLAAAAAAAATAAAAAEAAEAAAKAAEPKGYKKRITKKGNKTHFPKAGDNVRVMYRLSLEDGTVIQTSRGFNSQTNKKIEPLQFKVGTGAASVASF
jgi:FK506-binding protein 3